MKIKYGLVEFCIILFQNKNALVFITIQFPSAIIKNNCHARRTVGESLIIPHCYDFSLNILFTSTPTYLS